MTDKYYRVWAEVDTDAVKKNVLAIKEGLEPGTKICAVVKADAYGHGAVPVAKALKDIIDFYAVATIDEALNLRAHEIFLPIVVLGFVHESKYAAAVENDIRLAIYDKEDLDKINEAAKKKNKKAKVHIKADTGMNRIGVRCSEEGLEFAKYAAGLEYIEIEGIFTHFFASDSKNKESAYKQLEEFRNFCEKLEDAGIKIPIKHCANSAAATEMKEACMDMVRLGISMYGLYPSKDITSLMLLPALSLKSHIIMIKEIDAGETVGYGATFTAEKPLKIATIGIGYADGYQRSFSNKAEVLIRGKRAKVAGRVCMDQIMVDVTDIPGVQKGDVATLVGKDGDERVTFEELAEIAGTINYELACAISKRVPRVFYSDGKLTGTKDYCFDIYS